MLARIFPRLICLFVCFFQRSDEVLLAYYVCSDIQKRSLERLFYFNQLIFSIPYCNSDFWQMGNLTKTPATTILTRLIPKVSFIFISYSFTSASQCWGLREGGRGWGRIAPLYNCPHMACIFFDYNDCRLVNFWTVSMHSFSLLTL